MLRKSMLIAAALLLLAAGFTLGAPFARAGKLAQATPTLMQMDMTATPMAMSMEMDGTALPDGMASMSMQGERIDADGARVKIVSPANGDTIAGDSVMVKVETTKLTLGTDGVHFHLNVDGQEQGMSQGNSPSLLAHDLTPGEHTLEVVLANGLHQELDASHMIKVNVQAGNAAAPAATGDNTALYIIVAGAAIAVIGGGAFVLMRRPKP